MQNLQCYLTITFVIISELQGAKREMSSVTLMVPSSAQRRCDSYVAEMTNLYGSGALSLKTNRVIARHSSSFAWLILFLALAIVAPLQAQTPAGYWKFQEASGTMAADSSGNSHTALLSSGVSWLKGTNISGISANAANRDSVSLPAIDLRGTRAVTIAFWAKRTYSAAGDDVLFEATRNYQNSTTGFVFLPDDDTCHGIQAALRGNEGTTANCYSQPSSGIWHHLALVFDKSQTGGNEVAFYVDGVLQTPSWNLSASTNTNTFGDDPIYFFSRGGTSQFSSGTVNDLRIYNSALSATQIQRIYSGLGLASPSGSTISYVQGNYATPQTPQTTVNVTFASAQVAGDLNVVVVGWNDSTATVSSVRDTKGNVYTRAVGPTVSDGLASQSIYYAKNIASAAAGANTVTVTFSSPAVSPDIRILEYSGADPNNPVDVTAANSGNSTSSSSGSATTTNATDLIFGANLVQTLTSGPGSGFTTRMLTQPDGDIAEDQMVTATGSYSATAPVNPSGPWIMQMVAFRTPGQPVLVSIAVTPVNPSIVVGGQQQFTATGTYSDGSHQDLTNSATWTSSVPSVATIGSTGLALGVAAGSTTIRATSGSIYGTTNLTVTATGNFTISASPSSLTIAQGSPGTSTITTTVSGGFSSSISLSATGVPTGTTVSFNPSMILAPGAGSSTMTITVGASTPVGTYPITVTGNGGGIQRTATVTLTVTAAANFTISASPSSLTIAQGSPGTSTITTTVSGGFSSSISLSATGVPTGTTVSFNPSTIPAPGAGSSTMTITVGASTPVGTYPITVTGNGGGIQQALLSR